MNVIRRLSLAALLMMVTTHHAAPVLHAQGACMIGSLQCGDCDGNGMVNILDSLLAAKYDAMLATLSAQAFSACNVQGVAEPDPSADVSILDALWIAQHVIGLRGLTCCTPAAAPSCVIVAPSGTTESGGVVIVFDTMDPGLDPLDITFEFDTGSGFTAARALASSPLPSPATGVAPASGLTFWWDTLRDLPSYAGPVTFRITVDDLSSTPATCTTLFMLDNLGCVPDQVLTGMTTPFSVDGDTRTGGDSADLGCGLWCLTHGRADADNVLEYVIPSNGDYTFALCSPNPGFTAPIPDTRLEVRIGSCTSPTATLCNDDSCGLLSSVTAIGLSTGTSVYIAIEAYFCTHGEYTLTVTSVP